MDFEYLSQEHLDGFDGYKYSSIDTSPLSIYVMHPFWNYIVRFFPRWVAPNVMTFLGFLFTALNFVMLSWYDWGFWASTGQPDTQPIPNWFWAMAALNLFLAYTLDGIDGKQARRIGLSGPLGELFDHGLDSYTAALIPACLYSIFGRVAPSIPPLRMFYITWMVFFNFYLSHWEKYNTGVLYLPWGYDLSMWGSTFMFLITYIGTYTMWKAPFPFGLTSGAVMEAVLHVCALSSLPMSLYNIYHSYRSKTGKMRPPLEALRPLLPFATFFVIFMVWVHKSPTNIMEREPRGLFLLSGTIFSNISCRLIVAQMSSTRCEAVHWMTPIFVAGILLGMSFPSLELLILYALCVGTTLSHWHYGSRVVQQLCHKFNRVCFGVGPAKAQ
ncbi:ethanolaminephosphotransferase 1 [Lutzomyia longipalpis]|nr:ethanolaminephosphotransferase 1 [Lutzomyia longipalpis]